MDSNALTAAGVLIYSQNTGRYLWLLRAKTQHWAFPGGKIQTSETVFQGLIRELQEELGFMPEFKKLVPLEKFSSWDSHFVYYNFWAAVESEFQPCLNSEHLTFSWSTLSEAPVPLLPVVAEMLTIAEITSKIRLAEELHPVS